MIAQTKLGSLYLEVIRSPPLDRHGSYLSYQIFLAFDEGIEEIPGMSKEGKTRDDVDHESMNMTPGKGILAAVNNRDNKHRG